MALVSDKAEVPIVLDLGHLYSFQLCRQLEPLDGISRFPLDRVIELHVAGSELVNRDGIPLYEDVHGAGQIPQVVLDMLAEVAPRCENLRAVTIEVEDASNDHALAQAQAVKRLIERVRAPRAPARSGRGK
jgi:uncharacterized protein (UPF0276 family)